MSSTINTPRGKVEAAVSKLITDAVGASLPVYKSTRDAVKQPRPWVVIDAQTCEEVISPGSGIFDALILITYSSNIAADTPEIRDDLQKMITDLPYISGSSIQTRLSLYDGFHCYGWQDRGVEMTVEQDRKAYTTTISWLITFIPRNN